MNPWLGVTALAITVLYVGSTLPTPLYPLYRREFAFSELVVTEIYAIYVLGNLTVLFFFGRLADQIGRRRVTEIALGVTVISAVCFLLADDVAWLFAARVLNGFGAGMGAAALTAWIAELEPHRDRARAAVIACAANLSGLAFGALLAALLAEYAPWPLRLSYVVFLALLLSLIGVIAFAPETVASRVRSLGELSLRPRIGIPPGIRLAFVAPATMAFTAFALGGFYAALAPGLLTRGLHEHNLAVIGGTVAAFFGIAAATAMIFRALRGRSAMLAALALLLSGIGLLEYAEARHSLPLLLLATLVTGASTALGYRGSLQTVNEIAPESQRAEVVSTYLMVCYTANSLPVIGVGVLTLWIGTRPAHLTFAIVLAGVAVGACSIGLRYVPGPGRK